MTTATPPKILLRSDSDPSDWEPKSVHEKYSRADANIGEDNVDYVALGHMNDQAARYWLPRFLDYIETRAPADSFHLEAMLFKLANNSWAASIREEAPELQSRVAAFLDWLKDQPIMVAAPPLRQTAYDYARELWR